MSSLHLIITIINFFGVGYLIFLFYKKDRNKGKKVLNNSDLTHWLKNFDHYPQKVSLNRFNPFSDVGGDQSFIFVMLDNTDSGVIITSLHNRNNTRIYAKQIKKGKEFDAVLSKEEKAAVAKTIKINKK